MFIIFKQIRQTFRKRPVSLWKSNGDVDDDDNPLRFGKDLDQKQNLEEMWFYLDLIVTESSEMTSYLSDDD